eukprot:6064300-Pleurochrysis_carterae.AAC.4
MLYLSLPDSSLALHSFCPPCSSLPPCMLSQDNIRPTGNDSVQKQEKVCLAALALTSVLADIAMRLMTSPGSPNVATEHATFILLCLTTRHSTSTWHPFALTTRYGTCTTHTAARTLGCHEFFQQSRADTQIERLAPPRLWLVLPCSG